MVSEPVPSASGAHPGPTSATLSVSIVQALIDHARRDYPNEACGLIIGSAPASSGGVALRFEPTRNAAASPYRYEIDSADLLRLTLAADERDEVFWGIVHSHVRSPARPSPTDIGLALYPDALYLLVSLAGDEPDVRAWRIVDGAVFEVTLEVGA